MAEDNELCTYEKHHKQKILLFLSSMRSYADSLKKSKFQLSYLKIEDKEFKDDYFKKLKKIISKNKSWIKIKVLFDNYTGYIKNKYYTKDHQPTHKIFTLKANIYNKQKNKTKNFLPFASRISMINENKKFIKR